MFAQLSVTFNKGLKEYEGHLKTHVNKQVEPVVKELKDIVNKNKVHNDLEKRLANIIRYCNSDHVALRLQTQNFMKFPCRIIFSLSAPIAPLLDETCIHMYWLRCQHRLKSIQNNDE